MSSAAYSTEFHTEFKAQTARLLRPRFLWFLGTVGFLYLLLSVLTYGLYALVAFGAFSKLGTSTEAVVHASVSALRGGMWGIWFIIALTALDLVVYAWCWLRVLKRPMTREQMLRFTQWFIVYRGVVDLCAMYISYGLGFPWPMLFYHVLACVFLPWTPEQAIRPIGIVLVLNALVVLLFANMGAGYKSFTIIMSLFAAGPGVFIAWFKHSRRMQSVRVQMIQSRYGQMRRELVDARRIHEALFPSPITHGPLRLDYRYEPMRQIGGDYLYARFAPVPEGASEETAPFNVLLLDVTGHGIAAALTVNRLYGEVERLFAENPHVGPGEVLSALNKYVHLTLANHSVYATALCMRFEPASDRVHFASGGHPPAFICTADGKIEQLDSTAFVLGACAAQDFDANVQTLRFEPGDALFAYTDGAIESRDDRGRMLGVNGLLRVLAGCVNARRSANGLAIGFSSAVLSAVESHRAGLAEDDTLLVEVARSSEARAVLSKRVDSAVAAAL